MPFIRVEFEPTSEKAKKFHKRVMAGGPSTAEIEQAINAAWDRGHTPLVLSIIEASATVNHRL